MKILLAEADRDFLSTFRQLLSLDGHEVVTVFDGTQVITKTTTEHFDLVVLSHQIPRIDCRTLILSLSEKNIPTIVLLDTKISSSILMSEILANAYLAFPFFPNELTELMNEVIKCYNSKETISISDIEIQPSEFKLCGKTPVTAQEIKLVETLIGNKPLDAKRAEPFINSLNNKLEQLGKKNRIKYITGDGYRLVTENG